MAQEPFNPHDLLALPKPCAIFFGTFAAFAILFPRTFLSFNNLLSKVPLIGHRTGLEDEPFSGPRCGAASAESFSSSSRQSPLARFIVLSANNGRLDRLSHIIYLRDGGVLLSKKNYSDWRQIQDEFIDYMASLGPWPVEEVIVFLIDEYKLPLPESVAQRIREFADSDEILTPAFAPIDRPDVLNYAWARLDRTTTTRSHSRHSLELRFQPRAGKLP